MSMGRGGEDVDAAAPDEQVAAEARPEGRRSTGEWARLLGVDPALLTPADAAWFEREEAWVASARALMSEVLDESADAQWTLTAGGDA